MHPTVLVVVLDALGKETIERYVNGRSVSLPHFEELGLGNILNEEARRTIEPKSADVALALPPKSVWPDSTMGHRELVGYCDPRNFTLFRDGFPREFVDEFKRRANIGVLFNERAGGMAAIERNHADHVRTGSVVLYASMCDPIVQLAACESVIAPKKLESLARIAFDAAKDTGVIITRVITRPYVEKAPGVYERTGNRLDVVEKLPEGVVTLVDLLREHKVETISIGKCDDVINVPWATKCSLKGDLPSELKAVYAGGADKNPYSIREALRVVASPADHARFGMCNAPDTDSLTGHERNVVGSLDSMVKLDYALGLLMAKMPANSALFVTADHGMIEGGDYGYHNREPVPFLGRGFGFKLSDMLDIPKKRDSYAVAGYLCAQLFNLGAEYVDACKLNT